MASTRKVLGPFNRVEGDLEVEVAISDGEVTQAWVNSPLYRGFEQILQGKAPEDALVYTPRICGICSVAQSVAAANALADAQGLEVAENGRLATNIILACENLADHLSHFYLFFMPDFARQPYAGNSWHSETVARFKAQQGAAFREMLPARAQFLHLTGILAGKWPHSLAIQPGGSTRALEPQERVRVLGILGAFREFLEGTVFGGPLEAVADISSSGELLKWAVSHPDADLSRFLRIADDLQLDTIGKCENRFMNFGAYETSSQQWAFERGLWENGKRTELDHELIREDISHAWLQAQPDPRHPLDGITLPDEDMSDGYSWCKAPRLDGKVVEVGAFARQVVAGNPLALDLVNLSGGNVRNRIIGRLLELALVVPLMEDWARQIKPREAFCNTGPIPEEAIGVGMMEAARGSLGHWFKVKNGRLLNYQIIAPTTWNFSPRDQSGTPGALEQALVGTPVGDDGNDALVIQHIVRSFDPCMVCTVH